MPTHFDASIKDLLVSEAIASETTDATFYSGASSKEVQIFREDGQAVPSTTGKFFLLAKRADGSIVKSGTIDGSKITSVTKTSPVTTVPEYNSFPVVNTDLSVGDTATVFMKYWGVGSQSKMDWTFKNVAYTLTTTTVAGKDGIADGVAHALFQNLAEDWYYNNRPQFVHNKAGYAAVYTTEATALAAVGDLSNTNLVWVLANAKPYTFSASGDTFASNFTEKTSWTSELSAKTAEYVVAPAFYDIVTTSAGVVYIVAKVQDRVIDKFDGESSKTYVGAAVVDPVAASNTPIIEWVVTRVGEAYNPTSGKRLANLEAHLDKKVRQYGSYNYKEFTFVPNIVEATDYYTVTVNYTQAANTRVMTANPQESTLIIACDASADADTLITAINLTINGAAATYSLNDLTDVTITDAADGEILTSDGTDWANEVPAT